MIADLKTKSSRTGRAPVHATPKSQRPLLLQFPGLVAICLYMLLLAGTTVVYVVGHHMEMLYLVFPVLFIAGALGLLLLLRWAWALALAAVALASATFLFDYFRGHSFASLMQGLLNLIFFLYLVRTDVREKLK
jgi:uncharacterized membrane protein (DUF2068 family)